MKIDWDVVEGVDAQKAKANPHIRRTVRALNGDTDNIRLPTFGSFFIFILFATS